MTALRHRRSLDAGAATVAGLMLGASALLVANTHSQWLRLAVVAELAVFAALVIGDVRRLLLIAIVFDTPLQWEKNLGWNAAAANQGALSGLDISVTTIALLVLYLMWGWQRGQPRSGAPSARWKPAAPLLAFVAVEFASLAVAKNRVLAGYELALLVQTLLLFVYIVSTVRTRAEVQVIAVALVASLLVESILIIFLRVTGIQLNFAGLHSHTDPTTTAADLRLGGTIGAPNAAAAFLCILIPLAAGLLAAPAPRNVRRLCVAAIGFGCIALIMTQSRGGWTSLTISALVMTAVAVRRGLLRLRTAVAAVAVIALVLVPFYGTILHRLTGNDNGSAASRLSLAGIAWNMIKAHPVLGVGVNNVGLNVANYVTPQFQGTWIYTVHDKYLLVWSEAGIFALLAFAWFLAATIRRGWRASQAGDPLLSPLALGITAGIIGQLAHMAVDLFQARPQVQLLWFVAALLAAMLAIVERERIGGTLRRERVRAVRAPPERVEVPA